MDTQTEEHHIELDTHAIKPFLRCMARISRRYHDRDEAQKNVDAHLNVIKKAAGKNRIGKHVEVLRKHISHLVSSEKILAGQRIASGDEGRMLGERVAELESLLDSERQKNIIIKAEHKRHVGEMKKAFADIKSKMLEMIDERRKREERLALLQQRIRRSGQPMPPREMPVG